MESKNLIICDPEEKYAQALALYLMRKKELAFQVQVCTSIVHVLEMYEKAGVDILFISEKCKPKDRGRVSAEKVFLLAENGNPNLLEGERILYKYQSGEKIVEALMEECSELYGSEEILRSIGKKKNGKIIGIFSPIHRVGKTTYALKLGEELAESQNVLYLCLEVYGGDGGHFAGEGQTLSDVLYYHRQEKGNLGLFLTTAVCHRNHLDYIRPMAVSEDLKEVRASEWVSLIDQILEQSIYETLILDLDEGIPDVYSLLDICTEIHMPVAGDVYAKAKICQFERELGLLGKEKILKKIQRKEGRV